MTNQTKTRSMEEQLTEYQKRRFLAMPLAGTIAWLVVGIAGAILPTYQASIVLFIATGMIIYLGMFISRFTGENFLNKSTPKNTFMALFMQTVVMSLLVYAIAIPFFLQDHTSLPLTVGVLTGLMWAPMTWMLKHWIGMAHAIGRTVIILALWYALPDARFVAIPVAIVMLYGIAIYFLEKRWRAANDINSK